MKLKLMFALIIVFSLFFYSCKNSGSPIEPYTIGNLSIDYNSVEPVYEIDFGSDGELDITFSGDFTGQDMFLVKMNTNNSVISSDSVGFVKSEGDAVSLMLTNSEVPVPVEPSLPIREEHIRSMEFLAPPPQGEESTIFVPSSSYKTPVREDTVVYGENTAKSLDDTSNFLVEDASGAFVSIPTILKSIGDYAYIWVADVNYISTGGTSVDNLVSQTQIDALATAFNGTTGAYDGIYELVTNVCGYEYGGGTGGDGGKDVDQHINILVYDIGYDYSTTVVTNSGILGYFWGKDYYDDSVTQTWDPPLRSNQSEIFYLDSYFLDGYPDYMNSTLGHEFQHMINFNQKFILKGLYSATWYNEMLSMLVEDIIQTQASLSISIAASPIGRTADFVNGYYLSGITDWLGGSDVYYSYASSFLFGAFLTRNFGGAGLIKAMLVSNSVNQTSVTDALVAAGYGTESFNSIFNKYDTGLIYSVPDVPNDIYVINVGTSITIGTPTYTQSPLDMYSYLNSYSYYGPLLFTVDSKPELRPRGMSIHTDDLWLGLSGTQSLTFNIIAPASGVNYYLMFRPSP